MVNNTHPLSFPESTSWINMFLTDVIDDYRDQEIKEWLHGLTEVTIEEILNRAGHESLKIHAFIIPFIYLQYAVVPPTTLIPSLWRWLHIHPESWQDNLVVQNTKTHFYKIFTGKTAYIHQP
jgi:hypothetical protein